MKEIVTPRRRWVLLLVAAIVIAFVIWWLMFHRTASTAPASVQAVPVVTTTVARENVPLYLSGIGTVLAAQSVTVRVRVDGELQRVAFTEGQDVREGDLLAQIDPRTFQAQLNQAIALKAHDEASLASARKDLERYRTLVAQDSIQQQTLDTQQSTVNQLAASVQSDQAQIDNARVQLGYTTIRSPLRGRTGIRLVDAGNIVHAADATGLVVINQIDPVAVLFTLPEGTLAKISRAMQANGHAPLVVQALGREDGALLGTGRLLLVNNQIDTSTGTFQLKATLPNPALTLWPGQYVNVHLMVGTQDGALTVPESVVQRGPNGLFAYVVDAEGIVKPQPIKVAQTQDGKAIVAEGLTAGARVIVDGQYKVKPGAKVAEATKAGAQDATRKPASSTAPAAKSKGGSA
jgi:multidrug efflux system membrane fusion protein